MMYIKAKANHESSQGNTPVRMRMNVATTLNSAISAINAILPRYNLLRLDVASSCLNAAMLPNKKVWMSVQKKDGHEIQLMERKKRAHTIPLRTTNRNHIRGSKDRPGKK